ncbi:MAG: 2-hydroxychromene-2-carboxylate isomerase, partial [Candidatus Azotimanducaceae bacterium]
MILEPLVSDCPAIVYIDFKSPYAYLAVEPTRELERELGVQFDWRPFVLDIPSYLGSARLDKTGKVVKQNRSNEQWSGVKYAYYDCRRYASQYEQTIRGTEKIWDTNLVATAMLWVKKYDHELQQQFIDLVYPPFWKRELDIENTTVIQHLLDQIGANGAAFSEWVSAEGEAIN